MTAINNAISSIINGTKDFCCLCLGAIIKDPIGMNDEVVLNINNNECITAIAEVLKVVFDEKMYTYIGTLDTLCGQCTQSAISCYKFKTVSQKNAEYLTNVFDGIANNFEYTANELFDSKALYVSLNLEDFTSKQYYDIKTMYTPRAVLRRYCALDSTKKLKEGNILFKIKKEDENGKVKRKRPRNSINIPTNEMILENTNLLKCRECYKVYPTIWNLRNHFIRVHAPKVFKCSECPRKYGSAAFLESHQTESHCTVVCSECGKTFNNRHTLKMHEIGHHLRLVCQDCGRIYKNKSTFKKHIELNVCGQESRAHPSKAKFTCDYCNKKYTQKVSLRVHIQYEHGNYKAHICEWCGKQFWAQSRLKAHIVKHTREKNFNCSVCGGKFVTKESLLYHTRIHTGEKPYKCPHCDIRFLSASRRSDHVKRHHEGATLECDICHCKFNTRTFLLKHRKTHMKTDEKINVTYENSKSKVTKSYETNNQSLTKSLIKEEPQNKNLWQMSKVDEDTMPNFQKIIDSSNVELKQFVHQVYDEEETQNSSEDRKIYKLEVSDDADDFIKILGV